MESVEALWRRGRMRSMRAAGGGRSRPIASYRAALLYLSTHGWATTARIARCTGTAELRMKGRLLALWEYGFLQGAGDSWRLSAQGLRLVAAIRAESADPMRPSVLNAPTGPDVA